jgi:hypothetical protein
MGPYMRVMGVFAWLVCMACGFPRPTPLGGDDGGTSSDSPTLACLANQALRCDGADLVRCSPDGTAEVRDSCPVGCSASALRCNDVDPSNGLAPLLDMTAGEPDVDLGAAATINTDDGSVVVDGAPFVMRSMAIAQTAAPIIRVFIVRSLVTNDVTITGSNAFAVVSSGDLKIGGVFATSVSSGPGRFNDGTCKGTAGEIPGTGPVAGSGGGGFGFAGGRGGSATNNNGTAAGGSGGSPTGNPRLIPLRGGCDSGSYSGPVGFGVGGGAMQLVSRTRLTISGVVAANGSSLSGGGSGGGILLEAPVVEVSGSVMANGGAGAGGCLFPKKGEDGRLDARPASHGIGCSDSATAADGGDGGALNAGAGNGGSANEASTGIVFGGHGGGGVGRIRINTVPGGLHSTGVYSPNPSTGVLASR